MKKYLPMLIALLALSAAHAQTVTGIVSGTVLDTSGAVVVGATVTLTNEGTNASRETKTNETGAFAFLAVSPATYTVQVGMTGFKTVQRTGLVVTANERLALGTLEMSVGQVTETMTVTAQGATLNTENADNTAMLSQSQLRDVMIHGRDIVNLLKILPGVSQVTGGADSLGGRYGSFSPNISGTRNYWNNVQLDGQAANDVHILNAFSAATSVDAMAEVKVVMNTYLAEYGPNPGATVNAVTKSGTREFHGNVYGYKRHEMLNATDFFNNRSGIQKPIYRYTNFGFTAGGPIYIPKKFNSDRNKLFFFYSHEEWRTRVPQSLLRFTLPTELERRGDFSQSLDQNNRLITITDPTTRAAFPGNVIPASRVNQNGLKMLSAFPLPNKLDRSQTLGAYNYEFQDFQDVPKRGQLLKIDYRPTDKDTITLRPKRWWANTRAYAGLAGFFGVPMTYHNYKYEHRAANVGWTRIITPNVVNELTSSFWGAKELGLMQRDGEFDPVLRSTHGITLGQFHPENNPYGFLPEMVFTGGIPSGASFTIDSRTPIDCGDEVFQLSDNLSILRGSHTFKFGFYLQRNWTSEGLRASSFNGRFDFSRDVNNPLDTNYAFSNAALGTFRSYAEPTAKARGLGKTLLTEWYAQDTWKVTRKLTLNYGMRFSWFTPYRLRTGEGAAFSLERYDPAKAPRFYIPAFNAARQRVGYDAPTNTYVPAALIGAFVPNTGDPANGMVLGTDKSYPDGFRRQQPVQLAPRFGFAYDVFGNGKTAVRGGFGIGKRALENSGDYVGQMGLNPPVIFRPEIYYGSFDTLLGASSVLFPSAVTAWEKNDVVPSVYNWSFGIQQSLGAATTIEASYVGNVGRHLLQQVNLNTLPYGIKFLPSSADPTNPSTALADNFLRPFPGYGNINYRDSSGTSNYNALQIQANRRFARDVQFGVAYTWSKSMGFGAGEAGGVARYISPRVWNYGPLNFDQTHMFILNYMWDLPRPGRDWNVAVRHVLDNWQLSGITTFASGVPLGVGLSTTDGADITGGGDGARPVVVGNAQLERSERTFDRWFNTAAFARPARGTFGNAPTASFRGPGINNWDMTLMKNIPLGSEARFLRFRTEFYNAFNHTQFNGIDTTTRFDPTGAQVNARLGQVISTRAPRVIQLSLALYF